MNQVKESCEGCVMLTNGACRNRYECNGKKKEFAPLFPDWIFDPKYVAPQDQEDKTPSIMGVK